MVKTQRHRVETSYTAVRAGLFKFIRAKIRSLEESEDLLQDVYVQALNSLNALAAVDNLTGWLYTVARNKVIDWYRKKRLPTVALDESGENGVPFEAMLAEEIPGSLDQATRESIYQTIMESIDALPAEQKFVFVQQVVEGRTFQDLADETGVSINTLIARKRYAVRFLQKRLKERLTDDY